MPGRARGAMRVALVLALVLGALVSIDSAAWAQPTRDINDKVQEAADAVDRANAKVTRALKTLRRAEARLPAAQARLRQARRTSSVAQAEVKAAQAAASAAEASVARLQAQQDAVQRRLDVVQGDMNDIARAVYQQGPLAEIGVVLNAQDPGDLVERVVVIDAIGRSQAASRQQLRALQADLAQRSVRLEALRQKADAERQRAADAAAKADAARIDAADAAKEVYALIGKRRGALRVAQKNASAVKARYVRLRQAQASVGRAAAQAAGRPSQDTPTGSLVWPLPGGPISDMPGPRTHPVYGYRSCHTGLDIDGNTGDDILAADDGTVVAITNGGPYGLATLVSHGDGMATFYAHQSRVRVSEGDKVRKGEVIGEVGTSGWVTGSHLHFEVRIGGTPYNPMGWFGGNKSPIDC